MLARLSLLLRGLALCTSLHLGLTAFCVLLLASTPGEGARPPLVQVATACAAVLLAIALSSPWMVRRLVELRPVELHQAGDVGPYVEQLLAQHGCPAPHLAVILDPAPYCMVFGLTRRSATIAMSQGLLEALPVEQQIALAAQQCGHLVHGDFILATCIAGPLAVLGAVGDLFDGARRGETAHLAASGALVGPAARGLAALVGWLYAPFARLRLRLADAFALRALGSEGKTSHEPVWPLPPASALNLAYLSMLEALGRATAVARGFNASAAMLALLPVDAVEAARLATFAARRGTLTHEGFIQTLSLQKLNPWSRTTPRGCFHPRAVERVTLTAPAPSCAPDDLNAAVSEWTRWRRLQRLPWGAGLMGVLVVLLTHRVLGLPLLLFAVARAYQVTAHWLLASAPTTPPQGLLEPPPEHWSSTVRVTLPARYVGYGVPGQTWSPDPCVATEAGVVPVRLQHALGPLRQQADAFQVLARQGGECTVSGLLRVREIAWIDAQSVDDTSGCIYRASHGAWQLGIAALLGLLGSLLLAVEVLAP